MSILNSTRFVILFYSNTWVFCLMAFGKVPDVAYGPIFLFLTALNGAIGLSKVSEKFKPYKR